MRSLGRYAMALTVLFFGPALAVGQIGIGSYPIDGESSIGQFVFDPLTGAWQGTTMTIVPTTGAPAYQANWITRDPFTDELAIFAGHVNPVTGLAHQSRTFANPLTGLSTQSRRFDPTTGETEQTATTYNPLTKNVQTRVRTFDKHAQEIRRQSSTFSATTGRLRSEPVIQVRREKNASTTRRDSLDANQQTEAWRPPRVYEWPGNDTRQSPDDGQPGS